MSLYISRLNRVRMIPGMSLCLLLMIVALATASPAVPNPSLQAELQIAHTGEDWTDEWHVINTALALPGGGRAGFYRRTYRQGLANPPSGRDGVLYLFPESRSQPARLLRQSIRLAHGTPSLLLGVAANPNPRGEWFLHVLVNNRPLYDRLTIAGIDGWLDLAVDLSRYAGQTVDIVVEASPGLRRNEFVFIDYLQISAAPPTSVPRDHSPARGLDPDREQPFDRYYRDYLELLKQREDRRSQKLLDQIYQDQLRRDQ